MRTPGIDVTAASLSGGNQQKFIVGREMSGEPTVLIASHPTRGVDVGAQAAIWDHLRNARAAGLAVLLISADLDELIGMSDTLKVILRGRLVEEVDPHTVTPEELGAAMTGAGSREGGLVKDRLNRLCCSNVDRGRGRGAVRGARSRRCILYARGDSPSFVISQMWDYGTQANQRADDPRTARRVYYLSAVAVAIGFRMNLFNIGVDGQYRLAAMLAAAFAGSVALPNGLRQVATILVAMLVGACWAGIVGAAQGDPRGQRSHLDDHAQLRRDRPHRLPDATEQPRRPSQAATTSPPSRSRSRAGWAA